MRKLLICEKNGVPNHNSQGKQFLGSPHSDSIFFCSPREEIQASPETFRKKSAKSTKSFSAFCHLRGGLPHVCGFEGAVAHTWFLLMNQRLDGALFLTLENYSLMHFKEILMRTLEAQGTQLGRFSFQFHEVWCYLISPASLSLSSLPARGEDCLSGPYYSLLYFFPVCLRHAHLTQSFINSFFLNSFLSFHARFCRIKDIFWKPTDPESTHSYRSFPLTTAMYRVFFPPRCFLLTSFDLSNDSEAFARKKTHAGLLFQTLHTFATSV